MYQRPTILLVEDDRTTLARLRLFLSVLPYSIVRAWNGREAEEYLHNNPDTISLILLDITVLGMDGLEFLSSIKKDAVLCSIPVILQTAATDEEVQACLEMGADFSVSKPYVGSDLYIALIQVLVKQLQQQDLLLSMLNHHD